MQRRQRKITLGEMHSSGVRGLLIYCADHHCSHSIAISTDRWPDEVRLSDPEPKFNCRHCRHDDLWPSHVTSTKAKARQLGAAGLIASIGLQEKNTLRPQSIAVDSGAIRSVYLTEKATGVGGLFQPPPCGRRPKGQGKTRRGEPAGFDLSGSWIRRSECFPAPFSTDPQSNERIRPVAPARRRKPARHARLHLNRMG